MDEGTMERPQLPNHQIYTDGSKIGGEVGAAYTYWRDGAEIRTRRMKLASFCTVFQAELYAILQATEFIKQSSMLDVAVLSDSRSSMDLVCNPDTLHPLAFAIRKNLATLIGTGCTTRLFWVRAHVGIPGNERADELARQAAAQTRVAPHYDLCPISHIKREIRTEAVQQWNRRYTEGDTASVTKIFLPHAAEAYRVIRKMKMTPIWTQVLTGHGGFSAYLHKFKCKDSPLCACDSGCDETIQHLLIECQIHDGPRCDLETATKTKLTLASIQILMSGKATRTHLERFCMKIAKIVIKRNATR